MYLSSANKGFREKYLLYELNDNFRSEPVTIKLLGKHVRKVQGTVVTKDNDIQLNFLLIFKCIL